MNCLPTRHLHDGARTYAEKQWKQTHATYGQTWLMHAQSKAGKQSLLPRINQANWIFWKILYSTPEATTLTGQITCIYIYIYIFFFKSLSGTLTRKTTHHKAKQGSNPCKRINQANCIFRKSILATLTRKTALLDQIHRQQTHATYGQTWVDACTK